MTLEMYWEEIQCCRMFPVLLREPLLFSCSRRFEEALEQHICYLY